VTGYQEMTFHRVRIALGSAPSIRPTMRWPKSISSAENINEVLAFNFTKAIEDAGRFSAGMVWNPGPLRPAED
jgi:hypothetical protein